MESAEGTQDTETFEESRSWNETMEQETTEVAGVNHADEESLRSGLITPHEDDAALPKAIETMVNNGAKFVRTENSWRIDEQRVSVKKPYSVYFSLDTSVPTNEIIMAFDIAGVDYEDIISIQRRLSSNTWVVALRTAEAKEHILSIWGVTIAGQTVFVGDCDNKISLVKVYNAPNEMPDSVIIGRLSTYGTVLSFRRDLATDSIFNGVRTARMRINSIIPSTVRIVGEFIKFWHPGQPKTCRRCGASDHLIKDCDSIRCFNCELPGHRSEECEHPLMCSICRSVDHQVHECPYLLFSANVEPVFSQKPSAPSSYAGAAKAPRTVAFQSDLSTASKSREGHERRPTEKVREREPTKEKEKASEPAKEKERAKESSSRSRDHGRESRERDGRDVARDRRRERDLERDRERDHERERERERKRYRDRSRHHRHERSRDEDRHRSREHERSHHQDSSSEEDSSEEEGWTRVRHKNSKEKYH